MTLRCRRDHCALDSWCVHCFFGGKRLVGKHFQLFFLVSRNRSSLTALKSATFNWQACAYHLTSFPNSCLETHLRETLFRGHLLNRNRNGVSRMPVPKREFGNEEKVICDQRIPLLPCPLKAGSCFKVWGEMLFCILSYLAKQNCKVVKIFRKRK